MVGHPHLAKLLVVKGEHARVLTIKLHLHHRERVRSCEVTLASEINDHL